MAQNNRCAGCGKVIEADALTATVTMKRNTEDASRQASKQWGEFHRCCFEQAIDSPSNAMAEIRRIAKKNTVVHGKAGGKSRNA
jgi:hypothetical protein